MLNHAGGAPGRKYIDHPDFAQHRLGRKHLIRPEGRDLEAGGRFALARRGQMSWIKFKSSRQHDHKQYKNQKR